MERKQLIEQTEKLLIEILSKHAKIKPEMIEPEEPLEKIGIDSLMIINLNREIEKIFGEISRTLFFEYSTIAALTEYFVQNHAETLRKFFNSEGTEGNGQREAYPRKARRRFLGTDSRTGNREKAENFSQDSIAIIGISGRYPMAENLEEFWENLKNGRDCVTEVPPERWNVKKYYHPDKERKDKIYTKWGGFIKDVDKFDALFFNVSPREAENMDPQERIFLETAWHTFEDAGYTKTRLDNGKIGVFAGVMFGHYQIFGTEIDENALIPTSSHASVANRVSYFFNLHGPSIAVDTMCSSSLTAIYLACESLRKGECEMALAGGVNVSIHPLKYRILSQQRFASSDGRCRTFGDGGDGYVPGEGVGAVLLKPLSKAIQDRDRIYAVIRGTAINHGGKTNGYSVPNPNAQGSLIAEAIQRAGIHPETIGLIEAHGTGTSLGDPIEITGLVKAFEKWTTKKGYCSIGSVKSNIGHLEAAAGIAGLTKVILMMQNGMLVPSLHSEILNSNIKFHDTPFYVQHAYEEWKRPVIGENGREVEYPRRAGISAFGAGGTNVHIILEEYNSKKSSDKAIRRPRLVVISAKNEERLLKYAEKILDYFRANTVDRDLAATFFRDAVYTLQSAREALDERIAFVAAEPEEAIQILSAFVEKKGELRGVFRGRAENLKKNPDKWKKDPEYVRQLAEEGCLEEIAELWSNGVAIDWNLLYCGEEPSIRMLPGYPFARERYWVKLKKTGAAGQKSVIRELHPLVDSNHSTFEIECFKKTLKSEEFFIRDHAVNGKRILPGVAHLETARAACEIALGRSVNVIEDIMWIRPVEVLNGEKDIKIELLPEEDHIKYQISSESGGDKHLHSLGKISWSACNIQNEDADNFDIASIIKRCPDKKDGEEVYGAFESAGLVYGPSFRVTKELWCGEWESLALIELPSHEIDDERFVFHPALADGALRSALGIKGMLFPGMPIRVPFSLERLEIYRRLPEKCYSYAVIRPENRERFGENVTCDVYITDMEGQCLAKLSGFNARRLTYDIVEKGSGAKSGDIYYYKPVLRQRTMSGKAVSELVRPLKNIVLFNDNDDAKQRLCESIGPEKDSINIIQVKRDDRFRKYNENTYGIRPGAYEDYLTLFRELKHEGIEPSHVLHLWCIEEGGIPYSDDDASAVVKELERAFEFGLYSVMYIFKSFTAVNNEWRTRCVFSFPSGEYEISPHYRMAAGFANSVTNINHRFELVLLQSDCRGENFDDLLEASMGELCSSRVYNGLELEMRDNDIYERNFELVELPQSPGVLKTGGVYLITGGLGGLGMILSRYLAEQYRAKLVLIGRSRLAGEVRDNISELEKMGAEAIYIKADVSVYEDVLDAVKKARKRFGRIDGVFHAAGVIEGTIVTEATKEDYERVMKSKVKGTVYLDGATKEDDLDFFAVFSSVSAVIGDYGIGSYGAANAFLDGYAVVREALTKEGKRKGNTVSVNWPVWEDGGMILPDTVKEVYSLYAGMRAINPGEGIRALENCLRAGVPQVLVACGDQMKINRVLKLIRNRDAEVTEGICSGKTGIWNSDMEKALADKVDKYLKDIIARTINLPAEKIGSGVEFDEYGIDSVMIMELNSVLEKDFKNLPKTIFFEYKTIESLTKYFIENYREELVRQWGLDFDSVEDAVEEFDIPYFKTSGNTGQNKDYCKRFLIKKTEEAWAGGTSTDCCSQDIAIIGVSGRYPMADNIDAYWENLKAGKDCITEIPAERWDYIRYYHPERGKKGCIYSKWGGFIRDVDKFDPLFFNMSPREAELIDPQERLFIETVWHTFEDAGYTKKTIKGQRVGVFVGAMYGHYQLFGVEETLRGNVFATASFFSSIANRVSYLMDLNGPSVAIDTACSSSLEAVRLACQNIRDGCCNMAVAGGVNLSLHPSKYIFLCQANFLSTDGRCRSFGAGGDGYVPGEGVGAVLLKPLDKAVKDGDRIYAVIKGISTNHGGKTNGYSVPSPAAQGELIMDALQKAGVSPRSISYIEAHGTGTSLGDPIEIAGLMKVFGKFSKEGKFCSIGSVKSNIGHLESAAGIAGLTKLILQFKHKKLVPSLHSKELNPNIDFDSTPIVVQQELEDWQRPVIVENGVEKEYPRRAGISAFGAGGTNVHIVLEEYDEQASCETETVGSPQLLVLSAKDKNRLQEMAHNLSTYLEAHRESLKGKLNKIAYSLQVGREAMEERVAFSASDLEEVILKLREFSEKGQAPGMASGNIENSDLPILAQDSEDLEYLNSIIRKGNLDKLAKLWVKGAEVDWKLLYGGRNPGKISLPGYPFARERCWLRTSVKDADKGILAQASKTIVSLGALVDINVSTLTEQLYKKTFSINDELISSHSVAGKCILPGSAFVEMSRAAGELACGFKIKALGDVFWLKSFSPVEQEDMFIGFYPDDSGIMFSISTREGEKQEEYCKGRVCFDIDGCDTRYEDISVVDLEKVKNRCNVVLEGAEVTKMFEEMGFGYGESFQVVERLYCNDYEALAFLRKRRKNGCESYVLDPYMLDGVFRAVAGLGIAEKGKPPAIGIPFSLGRLEIYGEIPGECFAYVKHAQNNVSRESAVFDIWILSLSGTVIAKISEFAVRSLKGFTVEDLAVSDGTESYFVPYWDGAPLDDSRSEQAGRVKGTMVILEKGNSFVREFKERVPNGIRLISVTTDSLYRKVSENRYVIDPDNPEHYVSLTRELLKDGTQTLYVAHLLNYGKQPGAGNGSFEEGIPDAVDTGLSTGIYSLLSLFKAVNDSGHNVKTRCIFAFPTAAGGIQPEHYAVSGFAVSLVAVNHKFEIMALCTDEHASEPDCLAQILVDEFASDKSVNGTVVKYENGRRLIRNLHRLDMEEIFRRSDMPVIRQKGVYLITGGIGGLGSIFAKYLAKKYQARLVLIGRSKLDPDREKILSEIRQLGADALYIKADVSNFEAMKKAVRQARLSFGSINGIIHSAGVAEKIPVEKADRVSFERMLKPKVQGSLCLDALTKDEPLDFFVLFSSVSSFMGDFGAAAYAAANAYMDAFALLREKLREKGMRKGCCISINWPLWCGGGIHPDKEAESLYHEYSGMEAIAEDIGITAFERILAARLPQVIYTKGDVVKISRALKVTAHGSAGEQALLQNGLLDGEKTSEADTVSVKGNGLYEKVEAYLKEIFSETVGLPPERINSGVSFEKYGIDSVMIIEINQKLDKDFKNLPKTLLFEFTTLGELAEYFVKNHAAVLDKMFGKSREFSPGSVKHESIAAEKKSAASTRVPALPLRHRFITEPFRYREFCEEEGTENSDYCRDIAVIGISGRYPMAENLDEFWENLRNGRNCITEIPRDRWDYTLYHHPERGVSGKTYSKWGGFLENIDKFDPLFFNITPLEAESMDPQERLFLQTSWSALEDAGYTKVKLAGVNFAVGVFVGVMNCNYEWLGAVASAKGKETNAHSSYWSIANRVSYYLNLNGPSMAVDTACSSSLTAVHLACESIRSGECKMAIAGGVNLILHPMHYIRYSMMNMITGDNKCKAFGEDADGFVDGEGVGALVLKPLRDAERDGDRIYAVIKGSFINAGGRTNGYTVPSPTAQGAVIAEAVRRAGVTPRSISYVEAHGTGTSLGDPIEIAGLAKAFAPVFNGTKFCAVGSVKTNIGHLESASGVAGITKVILQMLHGKLVPSLHSRKLNPNINFENTPFFIQHELEEWKRPVIIENGVEKVFPRRAGVSSFGAGGANAHVILEEYCNEECEDRKPGNRPYIFVLSSKNRTRLKEYAGRMAEFLERNGGPAENPNTGGEKTEDFERFVEEFVEKAAVVLGVERRELDLHGVMGDYGLDTVGLAMLTQAVEEAYGTIAPGPELREYMTFREAAGELFRFVNYNGKINSGEEITPKCCEKAAACKLDMERIAFTLQTGREHMEERLAFLAKSPGEALKLLRAYVDGDASQNGKVFTGRVGNSGKPEKIIDPDRIKALIDGGDDETLAKIWAEGAEVDWKMLYADRKLKIASLPTYPFEKERYWIPELKDDETLGSKQEKRKDDRKSLTEILEMLEKGEIDINKADEMTEEILNG